MYERNLKIPQNEKYHDFAHMTHTTAGIIKFVKLGWVGYAAGVESTSNIHKS
jgi:predicted DNA-binding transcriptional regulator